MQQLFEKFTMVPAVLHDIFKIIRQHAVHNAQVQ